MTLLIKTPAARAVGTVPAVSAFADSATGVDQIGKIDGSRLHYVIAGASDPVLLPKSCNA